MVDRCRVQIDIPERAISVVDELQNAYGCSSRAELFRLGLGLLKTVVGCISQGGRVLIIAPGERDCEIVLPILTF